MSEQALENAVARMNDHDLDGYMELYADDVELHGYPPGVQGKEGARAFYAQLLEAFPDFRLEPIDLISDGDRVATRYAVNGTHSGELFGVLATGRKVRVEGQSFFVFKDGKIATRWQVLDQLGLLMQLGAIPAPA